MPQVYGYDADKNVHLEELSVDEILTKGIDPWRLDLFDEQPVAAGKKGLSFSRLTHPMAFAYHDGYNDVSYVGMFSNGEGTCVSARAPADETGGYPGLGSGKLQLTAAAKVSEPFNQVFGNYLRLGPDGSGRVRPLAPTDGSNVMALGSDISFWVRPAMFPKPGTLDWHCLAPGQFCGRTFDQITLPYECKDREIAWVFEALAEFEPVVFGSSLLHHLLGIDYYPHLRLAMREPDRLARIESIIKSTAAGVISTETHNSALGFCGKEPLLSFCVRGYYFHISTCEREPAQLWRDTDFSVHQLVAVSPDRLIASRLALHDIGNKTIRMLGRQRIRNERYRDWFRQRRQRFLDKGFTEALPTYACE